MTIFAKILSGQIPSAKIYEDELIYSFMDAFPQSLGHALIIPKKAAPDLLTVDRKALQAIAAFSQDLARAQQEALRPDGIKVLQYNGSAAGQTVFHYHMHLIPVWNNMPLGSHGAAVKPLEELEKTAAQIRKHLPVQP